MQPPQFLKLFSKGPVTNIETLSNEDLMLLVQSNDQRAFSELYVRFRTPLYSYFSGLTNSTMADELLQETFLKVINKKESYRFESPLKNWIWVIAKNTLRDYWRSTEYKFKSSSEALLDAEGEEHILANTDSMEEIYHLKVTRSELLAFIERFPRDQKEVLHLYIHSELSNQEIADMLNIGLGAVKSIIFRSKEKIIAHFNQQTKRDKYGA